MLFSSILFLFIYLPVVLITYFLVRSIKWKNTVLLLASFGFYAWGEFKYTAVLALTIVLAWFFGVMIERASRPSTRKLTLLGGVFSIFCLLIYFKYAYFLHSNWVALVRSLGFHYNHEIAPIHLPLGISFFAFQSISYLIDIYRKDVPAQKSCFKLAVYKSFFPQLIAGPIVRYVDVAKSLDDRVVSTDDFGEGARRFVIGLAQKALLANIVGNAANQAFNLPPGELSSPFAWLGALSYFFQIFYDFCGYSNMAIGLGRMFGFHFLENFNYPYSATSITDFWRRWHISLSSWFRDYLYIPMGGNRGSTYRTYQNLLVVFVICGLWHGASWTFVFWGAFHGAFLIVERAGLGKIIERAHRSIQTIYVWLVVLCGWVFFRSETMKDALIYLKTMVTRPLRGNIHHPLASILSPELMIALALSVFFSFPHGPLQLKRRASHLNQYIPRAVRHGLLTAAFGSLYILAIAYIASATFNPFIYFRF
jgi:alginate O-acetyltransferase complex protein AlgI